MRPRTLDEFVGQQQLLAPGKPLRDAIEKGAVGSMVFWGPPGTGKTTIGRLIAHYTDREFVPFSAVTEGVPRVREIIARRRSDSSSDAQTMLFVDEIHRFNRAQQDAFLPHVESGTITLIGATTENPSFEINGALLSRMRVFVLEPISPRRSATARRSRTDRRGARARRLGLDGRRRRARADRVEADGDARRALTVLEAAAIHAGQGGRHHRAGRARCAAAALRASRQERRGAFQHALGAFTNRCAAAIRNGALYWMARMIEGGEDPMTIFRRAIAMAAEDIGLADPKALQLAVAARDAYHMLGPPEGYLPLAEMIIYLATAPKSNSVKARAGRRDGRCARDTRRGPVPMHIRNAPTRLMKELGYHEGYQYAHGVRRRTSRRSICRTRCGDRVLRAWPFGFEKEIAKRLAWWEELATAEEGLEGERRRKC